jgi:hypothetical protein
VKKTSVEWGELAESEQFEMLVAGLENSLTKDYSVEKV